MNIKLFPIFSFHKKKIATIILVYVFLSTYTREFTWLRMKNCYVIRHTVFTNYCHVDLQSCGPSLYAQ